MKKFLLAAVLMLSSMAAFAQHEVGTFTLQPKVGLNLATITGKDVVEAKIRPAFVAGVEGEYQLADIFSLSAGVLYSQQGAKSKEEYVGLGKATLQFDYINIPVMANVYVAQGLAVKVGAQVGFNVRHKVKFGSTTFDIKDFGEEADDPITFRKVDFSIPVGLSYEYSNVVIDARYNWGLTKLSKEDKSRNSVFQFTVGYKFEL